MSGSSDVVSALIPGPFGRGPADSVLFPMPFWVLFCCPMRTTHRTAGVCSLGDRRFVFLLEPWQMHTSLFARRWGSLRALLAIVWLCERLHTRQSRTLGLHVLADIVAILVRSAMRFVASRSSGPIPSSSSRCSLRHGHRHGLLAWLYVYTGSCGTTSCRRGSPARNISSWLQLANHLPRTAGRLLRRSAGAAVLPEYPRHDDPTPTDRNEFIAIFATETQRHRENPHARRPSKPIHYVHKCSVIFLRFLDCNVSVTSVSSVAKGIRYESITLYPDLRAFATTCALVTIRDGVSAGLAVEWRVVQFVVDDCGTTAFPRADWRGSPVGWTREGYWFPDSSPTRCAAGHFRPIAAYSSAPAWAAMSPSLCRIRP